MAEKKSWGFWADFYRKDQKEKRKITKSHPALIHLETKTTREIAQLFRQYELQFMEAVNVNPMTITYTTWSRKFSPRRLELHPRLRIPFAQEMQSKLPQVFKYNEDADSIGEKEEERREEKFQREKRNKSVFRQSLINVRKRALFYGPKVNNNKDDDDEDETNDGKDELIKEYYLNEWVWAVWENPETHKSHWYPAIIKSKHKNGKYVVEFINDQSIGDQYSPLTLRIRKHNESTNKLHVNRLDAKFLESHVWDFKLKRPISTAALS
jgi:hypothetical protein